MSVSGGSGDEEAAPSTPIGGQPDIDTVEFGEEEHFGTEDADELNEKRRLIREILEMQATLEALSGRVDSVREENLRLRSENQVLGQYIENLMQASQVFQAIPPSKAAAGNMMAGRPQAQNQSNPRSAASTPQRSNGSAGNSATRGSRGALNGSK